MRLGRSIIVSASLLALGCVAQAQTFHVTQTVGGYSYDATATFTNNNDNTFTVTLKNAGGAISQNVQVLTGLFWQDSNTAAYGKIDATGSALKNDDNTTYSGNQTVAQHWAYNNTGVGTYNQGIGGSGLSGTFGNSQVFASGGSNPLLNGDDWGIVSSFAAGGVGGNENPFIVDTGTYTFQGQVGNIAGVRFQYGSLITDTNFTASNVPEGASVGLLLAGLAPIGLGIRKFRRKA